MIQTVHLIVYQMPNANGEIYAKDELRIVYNRVKRKFTPSHEEQ